jgi:hypothetical protein
MGRETPDVDVVVFEVLENSRTPARGVSVERQEDCFPTFPVAGGEVLHEMLALINEEPAMHTAVRCPPNADIGDGQVVE